MGLRDDGAIVTPPNEKASADVDAGGWRNQRERGAIWLIRMTSFWVGIVGRRPARILVRVIAAYYALFGDRIAAAKRITGFVDIVAVGRP